MASTDCHDEEAIDALLDLLAEEVTAAALAEGPQGTELSKVGFKRLVSATIGTAY